MKEDTKKLTPDEAAKHLGLKPSFLGKLRSVGGGPPFFKFGSKVLYSVGDLDTWLASKRFTETPQKKPRKRVPTGAVRTPESRTAHA
ncbi:helix-turn-helix domain-containing protein [Methylobacterium aquaticum]|uniref:helix-turn-helix domain-containing protein n=1 Tax=Methylobacterium aquaticum TaxID=270351 RepID=UPI003D17C71D